MGGGVYLALDDVIILVDLQVVARVAGDGAAVPVVEVAPGAAASELCIADQRLLAVDGFARVVHAASGGGARGVDGGGETEKGRSGRGRRKGREGEKPQLESTTTTLRLFLLQTAETTTAACPSIHPPVAAIRIESIEQRQRGGVITSTPPPSIPTFKRITPAHLVTRVHTS